MWRRQKAFGLLAEREFRKLYVATAAGHSGAHIVVMAVPLIAVLTLDASEFEIGLLFALTNAAFLLVGLPAGVWVDRLRRRLVLVTCDVARVLLFVSIPVAMWTWGLTLWQLYLVALLSGVAKVFYDVAYQSYLPHLVGRDQLLEANTKLEGIRSVAQVAGPGLAGQLIQAVTAAGALLGTALTAALSVVLLSRINKEDEPPRQRSESRIGREVVEGVTFVLGHHLLRPIVTCSALFNLFWSAYLAMFIVFLARDLGLREGEVGLILMCAGIGGLVGLAFARRVVGWLGQGRALWLAPLFVGVCALLVPQAQPGLTVWLAAFGHLLAFAWIVVYNVTQVSLRQALTPDHLLGRMNATVRFFVWGTLPMGGLLGGVFGNWTDARAALMIGAIGSALAFLPVFLSPLRSMRQLPTGVQEPQEEEERADQPPVSGTR